MNIIERPEGLHQTGSDAVAFRLGLRFVPQLVEPLEIPIAYSLGQADQFTDHVLVIGGHILRLMRVQARIVQDGIALAYHQPVTPSQQSKFTAAAVLEMMAGLIDGTFGEVRPLGNQKQFFDAHVGSWMPLFFRDLEGASASVLYAALAQIGTRFLEIESAAFEMD